MTDREIITHLATKVKGWDARAVALTSGIFDAPDGSVHVWPRNWNPLESIADAFDVQQHAMESPERRRSYTRWLNRIAWDITTDRNGRDWAMINASARHRCIALLATYGIDALLSEKQEPQTPNVSDTPGAAE